jgi:potassium-dependent mechanosensitive channel
MQKPAAFLNRAALAMTACALLFNAPAGLAQGRASTPAVSNPGSGAPPPAQGVAGQAPAGTSAAAQSAVGQAPPRPATSIAPAAPLSEPATPGAANSLDESAAANTTGTPATATAATRPPVAPSTATAAATVIPVATDAAVANDRAQLQAITGVVNRLPAEAAQAHTEASQSRVRQDAAAAQASADAFARARLAEVTAFDQQLKRYSTGSGRAKPRLSAADQRERTDILSRRNQVAALAKTAQQAAATASGVYAAIANQRRTTFASHIFERTPSPVEAEFWSSLAASLGPDIQRLGRLLQDMAGTAMDAPEPRAVISLLISILAALALMIPGRRLAHRLLRPRVVEAAERLPSPDAPEVARRQEAASDLGRSARAVAAVVIDTALPGLTAVALNLGLTWGELISDKTEALAQAVVVAVFWGSAIVALSRQLAGDSKDRLLPVSERLASHMRALPWLVALITGAGFLLRKINIVVGASLAATIAANCVVALAYAAVASLILAALSGEGQAKGEDADVRQPGRVILSLLLSTAIVVTVGAVLAGFSTLAILVSSQTFWISVIAAVTYLLLRFLDDVIARLFAPRGWIGRLLTVVLNLRLSTVNQLGVLVSGLMQVLLVLGAFSLALTPFGAGGDLLTDRLAHFGGAVHIGSITISPSSVLAGVASLVVGLGIVHLVERWVDQRYLPATDWDTGVQNSVSTGVRYLGVGLAILWALAAAGLGFKQIALVASALSVGIGFGLQQIVQNFVSGLILLVERPVKVGDWVNLGGVEGDVQRIRVRATEIRTFDRSTVIVPNSDLITKQVQNKTLGDPRGRVTLEFSVGSAADAPRATQAVLQMLADDEEVLTDPAPRVFIDSLTSGGSVNYRSFAYIASARSTLSVKSRLYAELLDLFAREKIGFIGGPGTNIVEPGPEMKDFVSGLAAQLRAPEPPPPAATAEGSA